MVGKITRERSCWAGRCTRERRHTVQPAGGGVRNEEENEDVSGALL